MKIIDRFIGRVLKTVSLIGPLLFIVAMSRGTSGRILPLIEIGLALIWFWYFWKLGQSWQNKGAPDSADSLAEPQKDKSKLERAGGLILGHSLRFAGILGAIVFLGIAWYGTEEGEDPSTFLITRGILCILVWLLGRFLISEHALPKQGHRPR